MKSSRPASAQCRSSMTSTTGAVPASRSRNRRQPANSSSRDSSTSPAPSSAPNRGNTKSRSASSGTHRGSCSASLRATEPVDSFCAMSKRWRIISASAQNATPSP